MSDAADIIPLPVSPASRAKPAVDTLILTPDTLTGHGLVRLLELAGLAGAIRIVHKLEDALEGPAVPLALLHTDLEPCGAVAALRTHRTAETIVLVAGRLSLEALPPLGAGGVQGLLTGAEAPAALAQIIPLILMGSSYWPADRPRPGVLPLRGVDSFPPPLTPRQWDVAERIVQGAANKTIAHDLGLSEGTVKIHATAIYKALGVANRAAAVARLLPLLDARAREA
jgi:DNA-binding NarL/FixJ family response regulator